MDNHPDFLRIVNQLFREKMVDAPGTTKKKFTVPRLQTAINPESICTDAGILFEKLKMFSLEIETHKAFIISEPHFTFVVTKETFTAIIFKPTGTCKRKY